MPVSTSHVYPVCNCAKEDNALMFLSTVYGEEDYKESYSFTEVTVLQLHKRHKSGWLCEWEMSVPAGRMRAKRLKGASEETQQ